MIKLQFPNLVHFIFNAGFIFRVLDRVMSFDFLGKVESCFFMFDIIETFISEFGS